MPAFFLPQFSSLYAADMDEDVDDEALQAQVDRSVAKVNEIVAGWMKPFNGNAEANKIQDMVEKDIEFYSSRPQQRVLSI